MATPNIKNREALIEAIRHLENEELIEYMLEMVRSYAQEEDQEAEIASNPKLRAHYEQQVLEAEADFEAGRYYTHDQVLDWANQRMNGKKA